MKIYAFADEASANIDEQIKAMKENKLDGLEIRNVDGVNISGIKLTLKRTILRFTPKNSSIRLN